MREEYITRINRVIDYIENNIDQELSLSQLATVANFSRYHFHRIFRAMVGETLNQFILRVRVEKAAVQLAGNPRKPITEIAFDCGFSSSATFARAFKELYKVSASEWRNQITDENNKNNETNSKNRKTISMIGKDFDSPSFYNIGSSTTNPTWRIETMDKNQIKIEVKEMPEMEIAYIRNIGAYQGDSDLFKELFDKLMMWAGPRGLLRFPETKVLIVYHDDPNITDDDKLRISASITVPKDTEPGGEIGRMTIAGGKFAVARYEIDSDEFEQAWGIVCGDWLPDSGYQPDDRLCYELCHNNPEEHPEGKHIIDICVPVKPL